MVRYKETVCFHRLQQLEEENGNMKMNVCRLKSQTEKLDQVSVCLCECVSVHNMSMQLCQQWQMLLKHAGK